MSPLHPADRLSLDRAVVTQPVWNRFDTAAGALGLARNVLLHAGPPFASIANVCAPIVNSACVAAVYEGVAPDFDRAEAMIRAEEIRLEPAQDHGVVVPLAAVVSASMPLHAIYDAHRGQQRVFAPINGGSRPSLRLGLRSEAVLEHLRWLNGPFRDVLQAGIGEGIALLPLAVEGVTAGDDCHGRTTAATGALIAELDARTPGGIVDAEARAFMESSPSLFLNLWMAATKCLMRLAEEVPASAFITAAGGNGVEIGIQVSALPGRWFTAPAAAPAGRLDDGLPADRALGAIGDSALVDAFGLGAMAVHLSPSQMEALAPFLPGDAEARRARLGLGPHPYFRNLDLQLGLSARHVAALHRGPAVCLGIVDREGLRGRIGGGIYEMPVEPFAAALEALRK